SDSTIHLNNRGIFNRFLTRVGAAEKSVEILRVVDKLSKIGVEETRLQLAALTGESTADEMLEYISGGSDFGATLDRIVRLAGGSNPDSDRLSQIRDMAEACGIADALVLAPSITRGLDYYTGVVFETFLDAMPEIGSVCSGGRYNDLASLYTNQKMPGVGASVGIDRLLAALEALGKTSGTTGSTRVVVLNLDDDIGTEYQAAAAALRAAGIAAEVFPERRKLGQQFSYAEKKGAAWALVRGADEKQKGVWVLRDMATRADTEYASVHEIVEALISDGARA
ncbi:MAG: histidine--tRNA ligase, partial [Spirochaetales bacterium]